MSATRSFLLAGALIAAGPPASHAEVIESAVHAFELSVVTDRLRNPWGMAFLPDGAILVTERGGRLRVVRDGRLEDRDIDGLPEVEHQGQGGLMGIALHPRFADNRLVYLAHAVAGAGGVGTEVSRGVLDGSRLRDVRTVFRALPKSYGGRHFGSRLVFANDGTLFVSLGDRGENDSAQDLGDHRGSLIRINDDGSVPSDNPFVARAGARPEIYTYGNRNMQGMARHPVSGAIWTHEHGPQGGDEVNVMHPGVNYGWPVITYGVNYGTGTRIGEGTAKAGMQQPVHYWVPSIAPSGMTFYTGDAFPNWRGNLFVGSLKFGLLVRLVIEGERVLDEERMLDGAYGRIRDVVSGPDGLLYLLEESNGRLLRLSPVR